jgi:hypothetical protein
VLSFNQDKGVLLQAAATPNSQGAPFAWVFLQAKSPIVVTNWDTETFGCQGSWVLLV